MTTHQKLGVLFFTIVQHLFYYLVITAINFEVQNYGL